MALPAGIAVVWWLELALVPEWCWPAWTRVLDAEERARAARFVREADRRQFIAAHALLRGMLRRHAGMPARAWRFTAGPNGKPFLHPDHGLSRLQFNLSHAPGAVACGVVLDHPIGVDIEDRGRPGSHVHLAEHYFAPAEVARLRAAPEAEQETLFFLFWTLKESYIKATGTGLSTPLDQFAFRFDPLAIDFAPALGDDGSAWQFRTLQPNARHTLSIAIRHGGTEKLVIQPRAIDHQVIERLTADGDCGVNTAGLSYPREGRT
ncbi:MAG: 4'-phosphopantetheinyl transferase superfamily protein [Acetobacteraceae bacterium]